MNISMKEFENIFNTIVEQIIFLNAIGEVEYHPEREEFLFDYFYLKYFERIEFKEEYNFDTDIFSLEFYQSLSDEIDEAMTDAVLKRRNNNRYMSKIMNAVKDKVEFEKNIYLKKSNFGITDVYLAELISKISDWLEDKGIEKFLEVISKTGEELDKDKKLRRTK